MKKSRLTKSQSSLADKQPEVVTHVEDVCRKTGTSEATFYVCKMRCGGIGQSKLRRLRHLEAESRKLS
ncbi:MAG TPA: hypothetical protein PKC60_06515 [Hydrogenophaga sp.]|uniref:transposase n=1 Tax=Hydrogenophaga sp. TaxID=1904254 RepID=UPI002C42054B|nr:transposase [Hydrogenophaga sp.]HMN92869.1 hypothetical protein [Hydrogenophaga sp.]HMP10896.1 hypothetical protein [Hydrogenophaga sp.]